MAVRDKNQNVGFVYTNIYALYKKAKSSAAQEPIISSDSRVFRADELANIKITKFQPRQLTPAAPEAQQTSAKHANPFDDLKANLNKLQDLHSKLRFMLKELEDLVEKK